MRRKSTFRLPLDNTNAPDIPLTRADTNPVSHTLSSGSTGTSVVGPKTGGSRNSGDFEGADKGDKFLPPGKVRSARRIRSQDANK
jgi:hypothetical protein